MGLDSIIEFIMENLFFLFIVLSGLFSLFKRKTETEENTERKKRTVPTTPPQVRPNPFEVEEVETESKPLANPAFENNANNDSDGPVNPYMELLKKKEHESPKREIPATIDRKTATKRPEHIDSSGQAMLTKQSVSRKKVIEGVVWAEILGKPRARKKHSFSYYQKD